MKRKKKKPSPIKAAWPIGVGFLIVGAVVGYVLYTSSIEEQRKTSVDSVRRIATGAFAVSESKMAVFPDGVGNLVLDQYVIPKMLLSPWSETVVPENFDQLSEQEQFEWANRHSDYVYLLSGRRIRELDEIIVFELTPPGRFEDVVIATFEDNRSEHPHANRGKTRRIPYAEADALIKAQTGYTIEEWRDAEWPGAGVMQGEFVPRPESEQHIPRQ